MWSFDAGSWVLALNSASRADLLTDAAVEVVARDGVERRVELPLAAVDHDEVGRVGEPGRGAVVGDRPGAFLRQAGEPTAQHLAHRGEVVVGVDRQLEAAVVALLG
jgi:hypothetical protein